MSDEKFSGDYIVVKWKPGAKPNTYQIVANIGGAQTPIGEFIIPNSPFAGNLPVLVSTPGPFTVAGSAAAMKTPGSIGLFTQSAPGDKYAYDSVTTEILGAPGKAIAVEKPGGAVSVSKRILGAMGA